MPIILDGTNGLDSPDLNITGTGARITGDFSNATVANRVMFQTSTTNGITAISAIPNGTGVASQFFTYSNSDPTNASVGIFANNNSTVNIQSSITGTGNFLPLAMFTGGSERLRIDTSGNVGIGLTPTARNNTRLQIVDGIGFPATQVASSDANTLDDYEEGTFTPTATAGTPGGTPPTFGYDFRYTKIGRVVSITGYFSISNAGTASGNLNFTGFPFASPNLNVAPIGTATEQALTNQLCHMRIENNSTSGRVTAVTGGGVVWTTGGQYVISITYSV